jgi:plasmid stabilization system protein ParE
MSTELLFTPEAEIDLAEAFAWYENQRTGLGEEFFLCVEACIEAIRRIPALYPVVHENYRRGIVRRFPYVIFYEAACDTVTIYGILHTSRDPEKWRLRFV